MKNRKPDRRKFLKRGLKTAGAAAVVGTLNLPASGKPAPGKSAKKVIYRPGEKPSPDAVYSPGIQYGNLLFLSGTGAQDPATRKMVEGPIQNQVRQCLENLKTVLEAAGSSMDQVLKCTVFLTDITKWGEMNVAYHQYFSKDPPARTTIAAKDLPMDTPVEIECIAYVD